MVGVAVYGLPCVNTWQKVCHVPNHFYRVFLPHGKEPVSGSAVCVSRMRRPAGDALSHASFYLLEYC
jgi:hypothetical protein